MKTALKWLDRLFYLQVSLGAFLAFGMGILVFLSALMRYVVGSPLDFSDELVALMFVSSAFLSLPYATRMGLNIKLDLVTKRLTGSTANITGVIAGIAAVIILMIFSVTAIEEVMFALELGEKTDVAGIPVFPFKALVLFSIFSTSLAMLMVVVAGPLENANAVHGEGIE
ncbi:TRAP transporter small permease [Marinobacterium sp. YM272]|uniref:TRAP transporter small permease n=1 Tax=Marinobacterium sp. YM272 TaxID=3421654 RepID=UPI003D7F2A63